jgi:magnesium chelatase family protein
MSLEESLETRKIYSVAGKGLDFSGEDLLPPFRAPHHTASLVSLTGGGAQALPGEISLAHNGVLYLDEMVQFSPTLLNLLRQPLEERKISISRAKYKVTYPASFMLVGSMNPCPCGFYGDGTDRCRCGEGVIQRYWSRLSGPLLDRIDLQIFVHSVDPMSLVDRAAEEASAVVAERVTRARSIQKARFAQEGIFCNAAMDSRLIARWCVLDPSCKDLLEKMVRKLNLSARGCSRLLKLARTLADLAGQESIQVQHLAEAVGYCRAKE